MAASRRARSSSDDASDLAAMIDDSAGALASVWNSCHEQATVSATQLRVLGVVARYGTVNVTRVAEELDALPSSASRLCARLEATGLLERVAGPDRRAIGLRLTGQGVELLEELKQERLVAMAAVLADMEPADRAALVSGLQAFQAAVARRTGLAEPGLDAQMPA